MYAIYAIEKFTWWCLLWQREVGKMFHMCPSISGQNQTGPLHDDEVGYQSLLPFPLAKAVTHPEGLTSCMESILCTRLLCQLSLLFGERFDFSLFHVLAHNPTRITSVNPNQILQMISRLSENTALLWFFCVYSPTPPTMWFWHTLWSGKVWKTRLKTHQ